MRAVRIAVALAGSVAVHLLLVAGVVLCLDCAPGPTVSAELDLSSVELSFADEAAESESVAPNLPAPTPSQPKPPAERPPEARPEKPLPPDPSDYKFPEPKETPSQIPPLSQPSQPSQSSQPSQLSQARLDAPPRPKRTIRPEYPKGARQRGEQGNVVLEIEVGADGACAVATVVESSGFAELDEAALKAARAARFTPARAGDRPVASTARLTLTFRLK